MSFSPGGKNIVSGSSLGANVWDVVGGGLIVCLTEGGSTSVTYSRDGKYMASSRLVDGRYGMLSFMRSILWEEHVLHRIFTRWKV